MFRCESISFRFGLMIDTTEVHSLIPVWTTVAFTQGHRVMKKLELVQSLCCYVAWGGLNLCNNWFSRGDDCKEVQYVWQIWIILLFSLSCCKFSCRYIFSLFGAIVSTGVNLMMSGPGTRNKGKHLIQTKLSFTTTPTAKKPGADSDTSDTNCGKGTKRKTGLSLLAD